MATFHLKSKKPRKLRGFLLFLIQDSLLIPTAAQSSIQLYHGT
jgi:hypothetical protein